MSSTIIELNENSENTQNISNGDFIVHLKKPIQLEKGNVLKLKSCAIDAIQAQTTSQVVVLPKEEGDTELDLSIDIGYYYLDWGCTILDDDGTGSAGNAGGDGGDNKNFTLMSDVASGWGITY